MTKPHSTHPDLKLDERARLDFTRTTRRFMTGDLQPLNRRMFEKRAGPRWAAESGAAPSDKREVRAAMRADPFFRLYVSARRSGQELMWRYAQDAVERQAAALDAAAADLPACGGSLTLDPALAPPPYVSAIDIHCMPGGYLESPAGPLAAGAVFELGNSAYTMGHMGPLQDLFGRMTSAWLQQRFPDQRFDRILEMGCTIGGSILPYAEAFPQAELHASDVAAPMLRYGDARARALGKAVHFSQRDVAATGWPDESFDAIVSHILLHETSGTALPAILTEARRLLRPGGVMLHLDMLSYAGMDAFDQFMFDNETWYNNEPFWAAYRELDLAAEAVRAGFGANSVSLERVSSDLAAQVQNTGGKAGAAKAGFQLLVGVKH